MSDKAKHIAVMTSGGDVPGLNACIRAVVRSAIYHGMTVHGVQNGFEGLIDAQFIPMDATSVSNIIHLGGTVLRSSRSERFRTAEGRKQAAQNLRKQGIQAVVLIGGDGSFQGAKVFSEEHDIPFIGIPKTIDNDIFGTDQAIGYDTALNTAMQAIDRIRDTAESHQRVFVVEVMGRDSGYIAYGAGIAGGAETILVPETRADMDNLLATLKTGWGRVKSSIIIVVAEGDETGGAANVAELIKQHLPERYVGICILGHTQRGGCPTSADRILAAKLGLGAIKAIENNNRNVMVGMVKGDLVLTPFSDVKRRHLELNAEAMSLIEELAF